MVNYLLNDVMTIHQKLRSFFNFDTLMLLSLVLLAWYQYEVGRQTRRRVGKYDVRQTRRRRVANNIACCRATKRRLGVVSDQTEVLIKELHDSIEKIQRRLEASVNDVSDDTVMKTGETYFIYI